MNHAERKSKKSAAYFLLPLLPLCLAGAVLLTFLWINREGAPVQPTPETPIADASVPEEEDARVYTFDEADADVLIPDVPFISQLGEYPTGCESVSAVMLLNYYGFPLTVDEFVDKYLPQGDAPYREDDGTLLGPDPDFVFLGDPRSEDGWGCYAPVIVGAVNAYLAGTDYTAEELYGVPLDALAHTYLDAGTPLLLWATIDMAPPKSTVSWYAVDTGRTADWTSPLHCLVLIGYNDAAYVFNDPITGETVAYEKEAVQAAYSAMGMQAVVLNAP